MAINERVGILTHVPGQDKPNPGLIGGIYGDYLTKELDFLDDSRNQPLASDFTSSAAYWYGTSTDPNGAGDWEDLATRYRAWRDAYNKSQNEYWLTREHRTYYGNGYGEIPFESVVIDPAPWKNNFQGSNQFEMIRRTVPSIDATFNYPYPEFPVTGDHYSLYNNRRPLYHRYRRHHQSLLSDIANVALYQTGDSWIIDQNAPVATNIDTAYNFTINSPKSKIVRLENGKFLVGGYNENTLIRLNIDGSIDETFNVLVTNWGACFDLVVDSNGKILVIGNRLLLGSEIENLIDLIRLNSDGTIDETFNLPTFVGRTDGYVDSTEGMNFTIKIDSDGKILVGGFFNSVNGESIEGLVRLNSDGTIDNTFSVTFSDFYNNWEYVRQIEIDSNNKIIVIGELTGANGEVSHNLVRLNNDGTIDDTFKSGGLLHNETANENWKGGEASSLVINSQGEIYISGYFNTYYSLDTIQGLIRENWLTPTEYAQGFGSQTYEMKSAKQSDGKIVVVGSFQSYNYDYNRRNILRLNVDGTLDETFNTIFTSNPIRDIEIDSNDKIIIVSNHNVIGNDFSLGTDQTTYSGFVFRLNSDGTIDDTFSTDGVFSDIIFSDGTISTDLFMARSVKIDSNGKIIIGGIFYVTATNCLNIARLNSDGTLDSTFADFSTLETKGGFGYDFGYNNFHQCQVTTIFLDSNKILVGGGDNMSFPGSSSKTLIRLNSDGTLDSTFSNGNLLSTNTQGFSGYNYVYSITKSDEGDIFVGGEWIINNPSTNDSYGGPVKLNSDGSIDWSFYVRKGGIDQTYAIYAKGGTIMLLGGYSKNDYQLSGYETGGILNLDPEGNIIQAFDNYYGLRVIGNSDTRCFDYVETAEGEVVVFGNFQYVRTFANQPTTDDFAPGVVKFSIGTIKNYASTSTNNTGIGFVKLDSDGRLLSILPTFSSNSNGPKSIKLLENDKLLLVGNFSTYGTLDCSDSILVINPDGTIDSTYDFGVGIKSYSEAAYVMDAIKVGNSMIVAVGSGDVKYYDPSVNVGTIFAIKNAPIEHTPSFLADTYRSNRDRMFWLLSEKAFRDLTTEEETELTIRRADFLATDHTKLQYSLWSGDKAKQIWSYFVNANMGRYVQDTPNVQVDTLDIWPADTTISEALGVTGSNSITYNRLPRVSSYSLLPETGIAGDVITVTDFDDMAWDPIRGMWSSALYYRFFDYIFTYMRGERDAKMKADNELSLAMRPVLFAGLYIPAFQLTTDGNINSELKTF